MWARGDVTGVLGSLLENTKMPTSMKGRLEIWYNAAELIEKGPWFGHGNMWIELWDHTRFASVGYYLMHNGYLEILIRHGLFGLLCLAIMLAQFLRMMHRGYREGHIPKSGLQAYWMILLFFMLTLLSNSNNRLAIGESLAMLTGGVAFYAQAMGRYSRLNGDLPGMQDGETGDGRAT